MIKSRKLLLFGSIFWGAHFVLARLLPIVPNYGMSFGLNSPLIAIIQVIVLLGVWVGYLKSQNTGIALLAIGGTINTADRLIFGYVRDYWYILFFYNNIADWVIFVGLVVILLSTIRHDYKHGL